MKFSYLILLLAVLCSCSDLYEIRETVYIIKKGNHKSQIENGLMGKGFRTLRSETMNLTVRFDKSARYDLGNRNQDDINKLFGFADCNSFHHENSARIGWNYNKKTDRIDVFSYVYQNGEREFEKMGSIGIDESVDMGIYLVGDYYEFWMGDVIKRHTRGITCNTGVYYILYPYFGGNEVAPQNIRIFITENID